MFSFFFSPCKLLFLLCGIFLSQAAEQYLWQEGHGVLLSGGGSAAIEAVESSVLGGEGDIGLGGDRRSCRAGGTPAGCDRPSCLGTEPQCPAHEGQESVEDVQAPFLLSGYNFLISKITS